MAPFHFAPERPAKHPILHFDNYADRIAERIRRPMEGGAFVFAIHGRWGSGKTTLMHAVECRLRDARSDEGWHKPVIVCFNPWKFQDRDVLWRAFILRVIGEIESVVGQEKTKMIRESLYRAFEVEERGPVRVDYKKLLVEIVGAVLKLGSLGFLGPIASVFSPPSWFGRLFGSKETIAKGFGDKDVKSILGVFTQDVVSTHIHKVESIEQFVDKFKDLVKELKETDRSLVVTVDDLDRCLPESALDIFEAIKLFMDVEGVRFILSLDRDVIRKALKVRYERIRGSENFVDPDEYVEKAITVAFHIPIMSAEARDQYLATLPLSDRWTEECKNILRAGLEPNPRRIKRFTNGVELLFDLIDSSGADKPDDLQREYLVKLYCLEYRWSQFFESIAGRPEALLELADLAENNSFEDTVEKYKKLYPMVAVAAHSRDLYDFLRQRPKFTGLNLDGIRAIISYLVPGEQPVRLNGGDEVGTF